MLAAAPPAAIARRADRPNVVVIVVDRETAIVLVGDHGYLLGDHGYTGKLGTQLHTALTRAPLTIVHPEGRRGGRVSRFPASTHDTRRRSSRSWARAPRAA